MSETTIGNERASSTRRFAKPSPSRSVSERRNALRVAVRPILCVHGTLQLVLDNDVQGVHNASGVQLARYPRRQPALLDTETVQELAAIVDQRLAPALP